MKQERFEVLIGANMPSVLAEVSFLTNQEEASLLATGAYLDRIADALFQAILEYLPTGTPSWSGGLGGSQRPPRGQLSELN